MKKAAAASATSAVALKINVAARDRIDGPRDCEVRAVRVPHSAHEYFRFKISD
jgi:hypothetical protein